MTLFGNWSSFLASLRDAKGEPVISQRSACVRFRWPSGSVLGVFEAHARAALVNDQFQARVVHITAAGFTGQVDGGAPIELRSANAALNFLLEG